MTSHYHIEVKRTLVQLGWMKWAATLYGGGHVIDIWYAETSEEAEAKAQRHCIAEHGHKEEAEMTTMTFEQRMDRAQRQADARPRARIVENLGMILVEHSGRREPLPSEGYAARRIAELVEDGFRIEDPHHLLQIWDSFNEPDEREASRSAAGYPHLHAPAEGTPMGDALAGELDEMRDYERDLF